MTREPAGFFVLVLGVLVVVAAAKGTWKQLWTDLTGQTNAGNSTGGTSGAAIGTGGTNIPIHPVPGGQFIPGQTPQQIGPFQVYPLDYQPHVIPYTPQPGQQGYPIGNAV